jgi:hypothetical protein
MRPDEIVNVGVINPHLRIACQHFVAVISLDRKGTGRMPVSNDE